MKTRQATSTPTRLKPTITAPTIVLRGAQALQDMVLCTCHGVPSSASFRASRRGATSATASMSTATTDSGQTKAMVTRKLGVKWPTDTSTSKASFLHFYDLWTINLSASFCVKVYQRYIFELGSDYILDLFVWNYVCFVLLAAVLRRKRERTQKKDKQWARKREGK